jgi:type VI secretion system protein ImpF
MSATLKTNERSSTFREPLFDRFGEDSPPERTVAAHRGPAAADHAAGRGALLASITRDVARLLNTRRANPELLDPATATVLDYGIPNFSTYQASATLQLHHLELILTNALQIFEPRLIAPRVLLETSRQRPDLVLGEIQAGIRVNALTESLSFSLALDRQTTKAELLPPDTPVPLPTEARRP